MNRIRSTFIALILVAVGLRIIWWAIEPFIPIVLGVGLGGLALLTLASWVFYRR